MRLDKFLSHCTTLSRKQSRQAIKAGDISVGDQVITDPGYILPPNSNILFQNETLSLPTPRYFMLYKPQGVISASMDADNICVTDLIEDQLPGLQVAGRLDKDASGLILLSDDGDWIHRVISPQKECVKVYRVEVSEPVTVDSEARFRSGIQLKGEDKPTRPASLEKLGDCTYRVAISEGRYHQVKRMFAACGAQVKSLHREQIGDIKLDTTFEPGDYRPLTTAEISSVNSL